MLPSSTALANWEITVFWNELLREEKKIHQLRGISASSPTPLFHLTVIPILGFIVEYSVAHNILSFSSLVDRLFLIPKS